MTALTPAQIATVAYSAGFRGNGLRDAVAVALAESGGNPRAVNVNADRWHSRDRGLWQINDHWHPDVSDAAAFDPTSCAAAAFRISSGGTSWSAWSTWPVAAGAQLSRATLATAHLSGGTSSVTASPALFGLPNIPGTSIPAPPGLVPLSELLSGKNPLDALKALAALFVKTGAWIADPHNWVRVLMVTGGGVGVIVGLSMIGKSGAAGSTGTQLAAIPAKATKSAATAGAAAVIA